MALDHMFNIFHPIIVYNVPNPSLPILLHILELYIYIGS